MVTADRGAPGSHRATGSSMLHRPCWCSSSTSGSVATTLVSEARSNSVSASAGTGSGKPASASLAQPPAAEYGVLSVVHTPDRGGGREAVGQPGQQHLGHRWVPVG